MHPLYFNFAGEIEADINPIIGPYRYVDMIGSGSYSNVCRVVMHTTGQQYACKIVSRKLLIDHDIFDKFEREVRLMESLHHPNVVQLYDVVYQPDFIFLILEYCPNGELYDMISKHGKCDEEKARRIFRQIANGLQYIHSKGITHRDLKPENILLDSNFSPKIADFGFCQTCNSSKLLRSPCGSLYYACPEIIQNIPYNGYKADIWSLGVLLYILLTGSLPWRSLNQEEICRQIIEGNIVLPHFLSDKAKDLIKSLLQSDPQKRPTADQVQDHPWMISPISTSFYHFSAPATPTGSGDSSSHFIKPPRPQKSFQIQSSLDGNSLRSIIRKVPPSGGRRVDSSHSGNLKQYIK